MVCASFYDFFLILFRVFSVFVPCVANTTFFLQTTDMLRQKDNNTETQRYFSRLGFNIASILMSIQIDYVYTLIKYTVIRWYCSCLWFLFLFFFWQSDNFLSSLFIANFHEAMKFFIVWLLVACELNFSVRFYLKLCFQCASSPTEFNYTLNVHMNHGSGWVCAHERVYVKIQLTPKKKTKLYDDRKTRTNFLLIIFMAPLNCVLCSLRFFNFVVFFSKFIMFVFYFLVSSNVENCLSCNTQSSTNRVVSCSP